MRFCRFLPCFLLPLYLSAQPLDALRTAAHTSPDTAMLVVEAYEFGRFGAEANSDSARAWVRRAASLGSPQAQYLLGSRHIRGVDERRDLKRGVALLESAAKQDNILALNYLYELFADSVRSPFADPANLVRMDRKRAFGYALRSAELSNAQGAYWAGRAYWRGEGTPRNDSLALHWLRFAADQRNHCLAQGLLGNLYLRGSARIPVDYALAEAYFRRAMNNPTAPIEDQVHGKIGLHELGQRYRRVYNISLRALYAVPADSAEIQRY